MILGIQNNDMSISVHESEGKFGHVFSPGVQFEFKNLLKFVKYSMNVDCDVYFKCIDGNFYELDFTDMDTHLGVKFTPTTLFEMELRIPMDLITN